LTLAQKESQFFDPMVQSESQSFKSFPAGVWRIVFHHFHPENVEIKKTILMILSAQ
jgi:hypothetical protein